LYWLDTGKSRVCPQSSPDLIPSKICVGIETKTLIGNYRVKNLQADLIPSKICVSIQIKTFIGNYKVKHLQALSRWVNVETFRAFLRGLRIDGEQELSIIILSVDVSNLELTLQQTEVHPVQFFCTIIVVRTAKSIEIPRPVTQQI